ncbi:SDR family NAD(P)-dependent oxidoreductase [Alphaproteobacteria bacterium]|jgi:benzil reductase ((S)-benzoin forming)|nr:SDR family NAD(P)-dependent oxidoreductase [Alphaproteobacteria bacterium]
MNNKGTTVITGASSGLGECLFQSFSKSCNVINISRSISASKYNIITNLNDLSDLKKKLEINKVKHDLCILNAGTMGSIGLACQINDKDFLESLKINVLANKIIIDWSILNGCKHFIGISSGAATKNYDGWLNYCVTKSAFRSMFFQYQKDLPKFNFKLISPGILSTGMNKKIKALDIDLYPDMGKFHQTPAVDPQKASELIYRKYRDYFNNNNLEIDLRNEEEW